MLCVEGFDESCAADIRRYLDLSLGLDETKMTAGLTLRKSAAAQAILTRDDDALAMQTLAVPLSLPFLSQQCARLLAQSPLQEMLALGDGGKLDIGARTVWGKDGQSCTLTSKEAHLLTLLVQASAQSLSRSDLLEAVWSYDEQIDTHTLETHIYRLRQKLDLVGLADALQTNDEGYAWCVARE